MPSDAPDPPTESRAIQEQDASPRTNKRQRLSTPTQDEAASNATTTTPPLHQPVDPAPEESGSSRNTPEMHRATTPLEPSGSSAIKYTRTGRVSKATKGQRVHHCDECGKTYTRAEHLRRHQQNHKPGAFPCDVPSCGRSFHREDLLIRHKARHNDSLNTPGRRPSIGSQSSAPDAPGGMSIPGQAPVGIMQPPTSNPTGVPPATSDAAQHDPNTTFARAPKRMIPPNELRNPSLPVPIGGETGSVHFTNPFPPQTTVPAHYNEYDDDSSDEAAVHPYYQPQPVRGRYLSEASYLFAQNLPSSQSPMSSGSSTIHLPQWNGSEAPLLSGYTGYIGQYNSNHRHSIASFPNQPLLTFSAEHRDALEQRNFHLPIGMFDQSGDDDLGDSSESHNQGLRLRTYWDHVHELCPIVHQPTYNHEATSPLLRTAILALGAQAMGDHASVSNARVLHERCLKVLRNRTAQDNHTYRVCDMQAIVLVELYSIFKSRRPPLLFSRCFEDVFHHLASDPEASISTPRNTPIYAGSTPEQSRFYNIEMSCKQRLLLACYLLEQQFNLLFGRPAVTLFASIGSSLPFPTAQAQWDIADVYAMHDTGNDRLANVANACINSPISNPHDMFQSMLIQTRLCEDGGTRNLVDSEMLDYLVSLASEQSARSTLSYHTTMLCKNTPIRSLLAVAGESWVMGEKLSTPADFIAAQVEIREWATLSMSCPIEGYALEAARDALKHALGILQIHRNTPKSGLLYQEWAVYLAALVVWAHGYVLRSKNSLSENVQNPNATTNELDLSVADTINAGPASSIEWQQSRNVLLWVQAKIERFNVPHNSGLVSGALDVLGKLIVRGNEDYWF